MEILGERPVWSMNDSEKLSRLDATVAEMARQETYYLRLIADLDASGYAKDIGAGDTARFLSTRYRIDPTKARRDLRLAKGLGKYDAVAAALPDPADPFPDHRPMHPAQAAAIIAELEKVPTTASPENLHAAEQQLVNLARTFNPKELRDAADRMRHILDTDGPEPEEHRAYQRESLTLQSADKGVKFRGYLANENAELFRTLIHAGAKPHKTIDGEPDPRTRDKRQADALTTLLNTAATVTHTATPETPTNSSVPAADTSVHPTPTAAAAADTPPSATTPRTAAPTSTNNHHNGDDTSPDAPTRVRPSGPNHAQPDFSAATRRADDTQQDDTPAGHNTSGGYVPGHGPKAHLTITIDYTALKEATADAIGDPVFGDALSAAAVRRLACDAQVLPIVLGSKSQPLDVGTTKRLVTAPIRLALNARDRGCVVCGAPPIQCEAHHLVHWIDGGDTCVSNLVLLCKRHHLDLHAGHWHIEIIDDVVHVSRPDWAKPDAIPPNGFQPPIHLDEPTGSPTAGAHPWAHATTRHRDATPDAVRQAIWGEDPTPAKPRPFQSPSKATNPSPNPTAIPATPIPTHTTTADLPRASRTGSQ